VAVIGFDDIPFAAHTMPPLTTMRQDCRAGARLLVEALLRTIRHERATPVVIPTQLVVRASSLREQFRSSSPARESRRRTESPPRTRKARPG
jgi:DNA-binding LacI/PurR family transcriptional regulator